MGMAVRTRPLPSLTAARDIPDILNSIRLRRSFCPSHQAAQRSPFPQKVSEPSGLKNSSRVEEFFDEAIEKRQIAIARERGFAIHEHSLHLYVDCTKPNCPNKTGG